MKTTTTTATTTTKKQHVYPGIDHQSQLGQMLQKAESQGLKNVVDFLLTKARKSPRTARLYFFGLDNLNSFISQHYDNNSNYNIQTIIPAIKKGDIDPYTLLNSFVSFLQKQK